MAIAWWPARRRIVDGLGVVPSGGSFVEVVRELAERRRRGCPRSAPRATPPGRDAARRAAPAAAPRRSSRAPARARSGSAPRSPAPAPRCRARAPASAPRAAPRPSARTAPRAARSRRRARSPRRRRARCAHAGGSGARRWRMAPRTPCEIGRPASAGKAHGPSSLRAQAAHHFVDEERIALGLAVDRVHHRLGRCVRPPSCAMKRPTSGSLRPAAGAWRALRARRPSTVATAGSRPASTSR